MLPKEYYCVEYERNKKEIQSIVVCLILGLFLAGVVCSIYYSSGNIEKITDCAPAVLIIPFPYGLYKTWNSCLVLTRGSAEMWIIWLIYIVIKLSIAILYGLVATPIMLIAYIIKASKNKRNLKLILCQMQQYDNQYRHYSEIPEMYFDRQ